jgi:type I restriction enzyme S subunit
MGLLRSRQNLVDPRFLLYAYLGTEFQETLRSRTIHGSTVDRIPLIDMPDFPLRVPLMDIQIAIAKILGALDDKVELNRRMSETLEGIARALFKSWFVDFDPVRAKAEGSEPNLPKALADLFPDSFDLYGDHEVPKGWKVVGLDTIGCFLNGLALQRFPPQSDSFLPVIKIAQLRTEDTSDADKASADLASDYIVEDGDVLFSWSGSLECVLWAGGRGALNQHLFKVTSGTYPKWFYYLWIHAHLPEFRSIASGKATTMGHIQRAHLSAAKVLAPPQDLLKEMDRFFAPLIHQIVNMKLASRNLGAIRDTLLPRLVSGELQIPDPDRIVGGQL